MLFQTFQDRLVVAIRARVRNGELTERRLARLTGISQPHMHNVLKGIRTLSPEVADLLLRELRLSLLDLLDPSELGGRLDGDASAHMAYGEVPLLQGALGPGYPCPETVNGTECYPFPGAQLKTLVRPVTARLAGDPSMISTILDGDLVLLDQSERRREAIEPDALYAVEHEGQGLIRWVRSGVRCIYLVTADTFTTPARWIQVPLTGWHVLEIVKARVVWIARSLA
jgi:hypothetical protein